MAQPIPDLLQELDDRALRACFDIPTLLRGMTYAGERRVLDLQVHSAAPGSVDVLGRVQGGSHEPYEVAVHVERSRGAIRVRSDCDCPVWELCKHAAAALIAARQRNSTGDTPPDEPPASSSMRRLAAALDELDRVAFPAAAYPPVAVQVDLKAPARAGRLAEYAASRARPRLTLRPVRRGVRENWIKTGIGWQTLPLLGGHRLSGGYSGGYSGGSQQDYDPAHVAALADLAAARHGAMTYYSPGADAPLDEFGAGVWLLLQRLAEVGVPLVPGAGLAAVTLLEQSLAMTADLRAGDGGNRLDLGVEHDGRLWSGDELILLGRQAHGVALLDCSEGGGSRGTPPPARLALAPLDRLLPDPVRRLVEQPEPIVLPLGAPTAQLVSRLRRHLRVGSADGSVRLPEEQPPRLAATVQWQQPGRVSLRWAWRYRLDEHDWSFDLGTDDGLLGVRRVPEEQRLLAALRIDERSDALLRDRRGDLRPRVEITDGAVLPFVEHTLPALRRHPDVDLVEVGSRPDYRPALEAPEIRFDLTKPEAARPGDEDRPVDWLDLQVVVSVDDEPIPLPLVLEALTLGHEWLFLPSGLHVRTDHPALARLAEAVRAAAEIAEPRRDGAVRVGRHDLGLWAELAELGVVDRQAAEWVQHASALRDLDRLPELAPTGVVSRLRDYQLAGFRWLAFLWRAGLGGILADDMGLGKTVQTLALVAHARGEGAAPFLVVTPTSVVPTWVREAERHVPHLDVRPVTASARRRGASLAGAVEGADVVVVSYTLLRLELDEYADRAWGGLVLDEAQQVKNFQAKTYAAVRRIDAPFRVALTGTPFENRLMELWALLSIVAPGLYPSPRRFGDLVVGPVEKQGDQAALDRFRMRIRPFLLRRTKELVAPDLPPKQEQVLDVALGSRHRKVYDTFLQRERQTILGLVEDFDRNRVAIFRSLTRLRQLSLDASLVDPAYDQLGSAKLDLLVEHLEELVAEGHRALVFSQFTSYLARVRARLDGEGIATAYLDGRSRDRAAAIAEFTSGSAPVFLISLKAGGVGLTLTEADYVFVLDPWWNPAVEAQAVDRAHRIGQTKPVMVYRLVATDTIEEKVMQLKARKAKLFAQVLDGELGAGTAIGAADVLALLDA